MTPTEKSIPTTDLIPWSPIMVGGWLNVDGDTWAPIPTRVQIDEWHVMRPRRDVHRVIPPRHDLQRDLQRATLLSGIDQQAIRFAITGR